MFFHVRDLEVRARSFNLELAPGVVALLDPKLRQVGPLGARGIVELVSDSLGEIRVKGHLKVRVEADCDRCLEPAECPIDSDFELYYRPVDSGGVGTPRGLMHRLGPTERPAAKGIEIPQPSP